MLHESPLSPPAAVQIQFLTTYHIPFFSIEIWSLSIFGPTKPTPLESGVNFPRSSFFRRVPTWRISLVVKFHLVSIFFGKSPKWLIMTIMIHVIYVLCDRSCMILYDHVRSRRDISDDIMTYPYLSHFLVWNYSSGGAIPQVVLLGLWRAANSLWRAGANSAGKKWVKRWSKKWWVSRFNTLWSWTFGC